jgi:type VII secretion effector (TIGR04197 family)
MPQTISNRYSTASSFTTNIRSSVTGLSNFTTGPVEGGNTSGVSEGSVAITELLQLFEEAGSIISRDAGKILQVSCEIMEADRVAAQKLEAERSALETAGLL